MRCAGCQRLFELSQLTSTRDGYVDGSFGMERNRHLCGDCSGRAVVRVEPERKPDEDYFADDPGWL